MSGKLSDVVEKAIKPALAMLHARMRSREAVVMLLAIGLQESLFKHRRQMGNGPARGLWQFEFGGGFKGVFGRHTSQQAAEQIATERGHFKYIDGHANLRYAFDQLEHDDVFAAAVARLLLWTDPNSLPALNDPEGAFQLYLRTWRPGAYARGTVLQQEALRKKWGGYYAQAMREVSKCSA